MEEGKEGRKESQKKGVLREEERDADTKDGSKEAKEEGRR